jgi:hypothetical protein
VTSSSQLSHHKNEDAIYTHSPLSIDGVCRRFSGLIKELCQNRATMCYYSPLEDHLQDVATVSRYITDHMFFDHYPGKKGGGTSVRSLRRMYEGMSEFQPDVVHVADCYIPSALVSNIIPDYHIVSYRSHGLLLDVMNGNNSSVNNF